MALWLEQAGVLDHFLHQLAGQKPQHADLVGMRRQLRSASWYLETLAERVAGRPVALKKIATFARHNNHDALAERLTRQVAALTTANTAIDRNDT